ncbi:unnamed protein product, partial [Mycena citricolor]
SRPSISSPCSLDPSTNPMRTSSSPRLCKITLVGPPRSGKSSLILRRTHEIYQPDYPLFDVYDFGPIRIHVRDSEEGSELGTVIPTALFDSQGVEEYDMLRPLSYPHTNIFLICFPLGGIASDDTDSTDFGVARNRWMPEIRHFCGPDVVVFLVGCKSDLLRTEESSQQELDRLRAGDQAAREIGAQAYMECSALTGVGVFELFECAAKAGVRHIPIAEVARRATRRRWQCSPECVVS